MRPGPAEPPRWRTGRDAGLVPAADGAGRALLGVVAILAFLAALTAAAGEMVAGASAGWRSALGREATIQVRPSEGRDLRADTERAAALARETPGVESATALSRAEAARLVEPWLGTGADLDDLPLPGLVVVILGGAGRDLSGLSGRLGAEIPGASLDTGQARLSRLIAVADGAVAAAAALVALVLAATGLAVGFATRGALAASREAVEILHVVGAEDRFIARTFGLRFLRLGLEGGVVGAAAAAALVAAVARWLDSGAGPDGADAFLGSVGPGPAGYAAVAAVALAVAAVAGLVSRATVLRLLRGSG